MDSRAIACSCACSVTFVASSQRFALHNDRINAVVDVVVAEGALEGLVASATAAAAVLLAVEVLVRGGGEDLGLAGGVDALGLLAGVVAEDAGRGRGRVGGGERGRVVGAAAAAAVVEETTAAAAPLSGGLKGFLEVCGL